MFATHTRVTLPLLLVGLLLIPLLTGCGTGRSDQPVLTDNSGAETPADDDGSNQGDDVDTDNAGEDTDDTVGEDTDDTVGEDTDDTTGDDTTGDDTTGDDTDDSVTDEDDSVADDDTVTDDEDTVTDDEDTVTDDEDPATNEDDTVTGDDDDDVDMTPPSDPASSGLMTFTVVETIAGGLDSTIYLPDGDGPFPVVVFTHGFQLSPIDYVSYGEHLASWGYVAVLPQFPGNILSSPTHAELSDSVTDVLDWIESDPTALGGIADSSALALAGHSLGGKIALLVAAQDERPDAVFAIDPVDSGPPTGGNAVDYPSVAPELMGYIDAPILLVGEIQNSFGSGFTPACAPAGENFQSYYASATGPAMQLEVVGASHMSFLDNPFCLVCLACPSGTDDPVVTKSLTREFMTSFLESELRDQDWPSAWLGGDELDGLETAGLVAAQMKNGF